MAIEDGEAAEKPVREQLKKASLAGLPEDRQSTNEDSATSTAAVPEESSKTETNHVNGNNGTTTDTTRGRLRKKRSLEELEAENTGTAAIAGRPNHPRKRSWDSVTDAEELGGNKRKVSGEHLEEDRAEANVTNGATAPVSSQRPGTPEQLGEAPTEATIEALASPKTKRSRLHPAISGDAPDKNETVSKSVELPPSGDASAPTETGSKPTQNGGFSNTSALSPFGALAGSRSPSVAADPPQTSTSAFASSGFSALSGSTTSGFGAIGKSTGGFGSGGSFATKSPPPGETAKDAAKPNSNMTGSTFGGAIGQQSPFSSAPAAGNGGFGSGSSGFGKIGQSTTGGFGSGLGGGFGSLGGGGLSSFASGKSSATLLGSSKPSKAFGAPADDEGDEDEVDDEEEADAAVIAGATEEKKDDRFFAQDLETGEEDETTIYNCRAKLYNWAKVSDSKKEWRERGLGVLRLNVSDDGPSDSADGPSKPRARFLMRAEGSHRVVLNTPVKKEIKFGNPEGGPPQGNFMYFMGTIDGKNTLELLQLKMRPQFAAELYEKVIALQDDM